MTAPTYSYFIQVRAIDGRTYQSSIATVVWKENIVLTLAPSFDSDRFSLPQTARTTLIVYNILGQKVATLVDGVTEAGSYNMSWNAANVASGVYIYQVKSNNFTSRKKMMLLR